MLSRRSILAAAFAVPRIEIRQDTAASQIVVQTGKIKTAFHHGERWPKPFLYPILSPGGTDMSRAFPLSSRAGESTDHGWHRGLWLGHGDINGVDFWREIRPENTGLIRREGHAEIRKSSFAVNTLLLPPGPGKALGRLRQEWAFSWRPRGLAIDTTFVYHASEGLALKFADTDDGGFGLRIRDEFREDRGAVMLSDDGRRGTKALWGKPAKWIDYSALVEGKACGVAMFDHPKNLRYPTAWHARPYGLNAANPFANRSFNGKSAPGGEYEIAAGARLTLRYRVLLHDGMGEGLQLDEEAPR
jgi:hypothetical protein